MKKKEKKDDDEQKKKRRSVAESNSYRKIVKEKERWTKNMHIEIVWRALRRKMCVSTMIKGNLLEYIGGWNKKKNKKVG